MFIFVHSGVRFRTPEYRFQSLHKNIFFNIIIYKLYVDEQLVFDYEH